MSTLDGLILQARQEERAQVAQHYDTLIGQLNAQVPCQA